MLKKHDYNLAEFQGITAERDSASSRYLGEYLPRPGIDVARHAQGLISLTYDQVPLNIEVDLDYTQRDLSLQEALTLLPLTINTSEYQQTLARFDCTGLQDMAFKVLARNAAPQETRPPSETKPAQNLYVLLNGWTANGDIYTEITKPNGLTVAEEILALDPDAVVVVVDGDGFGDSSFKENVLRKDIGAHCSPDAYAEQIDLLVRDVFGTTPEGMQHVSVMGHSLGGAATLILAARYEGYENNLALAPAFFPTHQNLREIERFLSSATNIERLKGFAKEMGIHSETDLIYQALGRSLQVGAQVFPVMDALVGKVTKATFSKVGPSLIGNEITGDEQDDEQIRQALYDLHEGELKDPRLVSAALLQLKKGVDLSQWTLEEFKRINDVLLITAAEDALVSRRDIRNLLSVLITYELLRWAESSSTTSDAELQTLIRANLAYIRDELQSNPQEVPSRSEVPGGHYAPVYDKNTPISLVWKNVSNTVPSKNSDYE